MRLEPTVSKGPKIDQVEIRSGVAIATQGKHKVTTAKMRNLRVLMGLPVGPFLLEGCFNSSHFFTIWRPRTVGSQRTDLEQMFRRVLLRLPFWPSSLLLNEFVDTLP